ncbi:MAG TPA: hypothetical protein VLS90_15455 [Thermodesulfobacteriota bacterium]|nr:hypothetical protein [Thermodesulfobacteriota bacterium]
MRWILGLAAFLLLYFGYTQVYMRPVGAARGDAIDVSGEPRQTSILSPETIQVEFHGRNYLLEKHHRYEIAGEVLSIETYRLSFRNEFFDVDLGLIWGPRIKELKQKYQFSQAARWLIWSSKGPVSAEERRYITSHISNNHLIPADGRGNLAKALRWPARGDKVRIAGYLVTIKDLSGRTVTASSISRGDTGAGACEMIWVEEIQINEKIYK